MSFLGIFNRSGLCKHTDEIIDFECKGNAIRFYLGENGEQYGEGWYIDDYNVNSGKVDDKYISGVKDIYIDFDVFIFEPSRQFSKETIRDNRLPCLNIGGITVRFGDSIYSVMNVLKAIIR